MKVIQQRKEEKKSGRTEGRKGRLHEQHMVGSYEGDNEMIKHKAEKRTQGKEEGKIPQKQW